jgi:2-dehydropantoate 2-reductase
MLVTIAGCGALGSLLAARMMEGGLEVQAFQRDGAHSEVLTRRGITIEGDRGGVSRTFPLKKVSSRPEDLQHSRLILVMVKSYDTDKVGSVQSILEKDGVVLTLQNGLGNAQTLAGSFGEHRVAAGITNYAAFRISPGVIGWGGDGQITFGSWQKDRPMDWVCALLKEAGLNTSYVADPRPFLWKKVAVNATINTITALTGLCNGDLLKSEPVLEMMKKICEETITAAERSGVELDNKDIWEMVVSTMKMTSRNRSSMLQDVEKGRKTEIESIAGSILKLARDREEFPHTRTLYSLIRSMDESTERKGSIPS